MPIQSHPACRKPDPDSEICRFMTMDKFRDLFASEEIYLRRVDLFKETDPREGMPDDKSVRKSLGLQEGLLEDEKKLNNHQAFIRQHSEGTFINCWHLFEGETFEMWQTYAAGADQKGITGSGIVIFSRVNLLREAIDAWLDPVFLGIVRYGNKEDGNLFDILFTKHKHFDKEKELRVLIQCYDPMANTSRNFDINNFPHAEPLAENPMHHWVHPYKRRRIDLKKLVTEIRVSPWATKNEVEEVWWWVKNKGKLCPIESSHLAIPRVIIPAMT